MKKPVIGITMGDPAGIGPELCLRILESRTVRRTCTPVVFGDAGILEKVSRRCRIPLKAEILSVGEWQARKSPVHPVAVDCPGKTRLDGIVPGRIQRRAGAAAYAYIKEAVAAALRHRVAAVVTAPISKESLNLAGHLYPGHTELLAALTRRRRVCMMMASDDIKVSLATTHLALAEVPRALTRNGILSAMRLTAESLRTLGRAHPRLTVCALNPHAGENGLFGNEEGRRIARAIRDARREGLAVRGPLPADTAFLPPTRRRTDAYVAMYHDQGLIPFKMLAFETGVNVTLGLPFPRTSPDHGTAFDIAWKGKASAASMIQSVLWAVRLARA